MSWILFLDTVNACGHNASISEVVNILIGSDGAWVEDAISGAGFEFNATIPYNNYRLSEAGISSSSDSINKSTAQYDTGMTTERMIARVNANFRAGLLTFREAKAQLFAIQLETGNVSKQEISDFTITKANNICPGEAGGDEDIVILGPSKEKLQQLLMCCELIKHNVGSLLELVTNAAYMMTMLDEAAPRTEI